MSTLTLRGDNSNIDTGDNINAITCCGPTYIEHECIYCSVCQKLLYKGLKSEFIDFGGGSTAMCFNTGASNRNSMFPDGFDSYKRKRVNRIIERIQKRYPFVSSAVLQIVRSLFIDIMCQFNMYGESNFKLDYFIAFVLFRVQYSIPAFFTDKMFYLDKLFLSKFKISEMERENKKRFGHKKKAKVLEYAHIYKRGMIMFEVTDSNIGDVDFSPSTADICRFYENKFIQKYIREIPGGEIKGYMPSPIPLINTINFTTVTTISRVNLVAIYIYSCLEFIQLMATKTGNEKYNWVYSKGVARLKSFIVNAELPSFKWIRRKTIRCAKASKKLTAIELGFPYKTTFVRQLFGNDVFIEHCKRIVKTRTNITFADRQKIYQKRIDPIERRKRALKM